MTTNDPPAQDATPDPLGEFLAGVVRYLEGRAKTIYRHSAALGLLPHESPEKVEWNLVQILLSQGRNERYKRGDGVLP